MLLSIVLAVSAAVTVGQQNSPAVPQEQIPYRLLDRDVSTTKISGTVAGYMVSVDRFLKPEEIKALICQVLQKEKPPSSSRLAVEIFYMLESFNPRAEIFGPTAQFADHIVADYVWNAETGHHRLIAMRDGDGVSLNPPVGYDFDHTAAC